MDKAQYKNVYVFVEQREGVIQNVGLAMYLPCHFD